MLKSVSDEQFYELFLDIRNLLEKLCSRSEPFIQLNITDSERISIDNLNILSGGRKHRFCTPNAVQNHFLVKSPHPFISTLVSPEVTSALAD